MKTLYRDKVGENIYFENIENEKKNGIEKIYYLGLIIITVVIFLVVAIEGQGAEIPSSQIKAKAPTKIDILKIARIESSLNPRAWNRQTNCRGLHQISPIVLKDYNKRHKTKYTQEDLFDPEINTKIAIWYFNFAIPYMLKDASIPDTLKNRLIAYHDGIGNLKRYVRGERRLGKNMQGYLRKYFG